MTVTPENHPHKALLVAYHFPPIRVSSGLQRTLSMARYLPDNGWQPLILSAHPRAYETTSTDQLKDIPPEVMVKRAWALDTARHLSFKDRYPGFLALPDRWISWWLGGVASGLRLIRQHKPALIWSTYPIASAHLIGLTLHKLTGIPWVADFRDSMTEPDYPTDARTWKVYRWIEKKAVQHAKALVFTAPSAVRMYQERYPDKDKSCFHLITNGFDENLFQQVEANLSPPTQNRETETKSGEPLTLIHSGVIYPSERDPRHFFSALAELKIDGLISADKLKIKLRATGHDDLFQPMLDSHNISDIVSLEPGVDYQQALTEMTQADGLLLLQDASCNHQIPAKLYEYMRVGKPIIALTDKAGDTAATMQSAGLNAIYDLTDKESIKAGLKAFLEQPRAQGCEREQAMAYSREQLTGRYAGLFNSLFADLG